MIKKTVNLLPIAAGVLFGSVGIFVRTLDGAGFGNITIIFSRAALAAVIMFICLAVKDISLLKIQPKNFIYLAGCAILGMLGTNLCFNISSTHLSLSLAAVLLSIFPIYVLIFSRIVFKEEITKKKTVCMVLAIAGCVMVSGIIGSAVSVSGAGLAAGLISGVTYGAYGIISKFAMNSGLKSLTVTFYSLLILAVILAPFADYSAIYSFAAEAPARGIGFMFLHSLCIGVLPYLCYTTALQYIEPGKASILASCEPVAAMIFGLVFFSEIPTIISIAGMVLTLVALAVMCKD